MEYRQSLHKTLALGMTRPQFRPGNAVKFRSDLEKDEPLLNPHEGISVANSQCTNFFSLCCSRGFLVEKVKPEIRVDTQN